MIKIRQAREKDLEVIYRIGLCEEGSAVSPKTRFYGKEYIRRWLKNLGEEILLIGEIDGKVGGFIFCSLMQNTWAMLENLVVAPWARGKGLGAAFLKELLRQLNERGIDYIGSWVRAENKEALKFLEKRGFRRGYQFLWIEKMTRPLWLEHKRDLKRFKEEKL